MQELISRICQKTGITPQQAESAVVTIKDFLKEKAPMIAGTVDNFFDKADSVVPDITEVPVQSKADGILDKISDIIPGETGQKIEDFAKKAAHKAEDVFDDVKGKLDGFLDKGKK